MVVQEEGVGLVDSLPLMLVVLVIHQAPLHLRVITVVVEIQLELLLVVVAAVRVLLAALGVG
jgi:hypothetical protein